MWKGVSGDRLFKPRVRDLHGRGLARFMPAFEVDHAFVSDHYMHRDSLIDPRFELSKRPFGTVSPNDVSVTFDCSYNGFILRVI